MLNEKDLINGYANITGGGLVDNAKRFLKNLSASTFKQYKNFKNFKWLSEKA